MGNPVDFVIGGSSCKELVRWRDTLSTKIAESDPGLVGVDWDCKETAPQLKAVTDCDRAAELGVTAGGPRRLLIAKASLKIANLLAI